VIGALPKLLCRQSAGLIERARVPATLGVLLAVVITVCAVLLAADRRRGGAWSRRWIGAATPEALAAIRIVVLGVAFLMVAWEDLPSTASIPRSMLESHGKGVMSIVGRVPGYGAFAASHAALWAFKVLVLGLLALGAAGLRTRIVLPLGAAAYLLYGGILRQYVHFFHQGLLPLYVMVVLVFTPCADAWSLDRRIREKRGLPVPPAEVPAAVYGAARWAVFALIGLCYLSAGISKLRLGGLLWWEAENMRSKILLAALEPKLGLPFGMPLARQPDAVLAALGLTTLGIELGMITVAFSRRSWPLAGALLWLMHVGILVSQEILFLDLLVLPVVFLQPHHLARAARALFRDRSEARRHLRAALAECGFGRGAAPDIGTAPPSETTAPPEPPPRALKWLVYGVAAYIPLLALAIEWYPLTAWQMYAYRLPTTEVVYLDVREQSEGGTSHPARLGDDIGALIDNRYYAALWAYFEAGAAGDRRPIDELFQKIMDLRNARAPAERRIVAFVIERRTWDRRAAPSDPRAGRLLDHYVYPVPAEPPGAAP
jgi:hypothetical protein